MTAPRPRQPIPHGGESTHRPHHAIPLIAATTSIGAHGGPQGPALSREEGQGDEAMRPKGQRLVESLETPRGEAEISRARGKGEPWDLSRPCWEGASSLAPLLPLSRTWRVLVTPPSGGPHSHLGQQEPGAG